MRRMLKTRGFLLWLSLAFTITACAANPSITEAEKKQIVENVKSVVQNEFDLYYFKKTYAQYDEALNGIVGEEYLAALSDDIVFGYNDNAYTREDLANMTAEEYAQHKDFMLRLIRSMGLDKVRAIVKISDVYEGSRHGQIHVYAMESKELHDRPMTTTTLKYALEKRDGKWLVTGVERDKLSHGPDASAEDIEAGIEALQFQQHEGEAVRYATVIELSGAEE